MVFAQKKGEKKTAQQEFVAQLNQCASYIDKKKYYQARDFCLRLAKQGYAIAQFNTALLYYQGHGVVKDERLAYKWMKKAALQNYPKAQYNLAIMTANGQGVKADLVSAFAWISLAQENQYEDAETVKKNMQEEMTEEELQKAAAIYKDLKEKI